MVLINSSFWRRFTDRTRGVGPRGLLVFAAAGAGLTVAMGAGWGVAGSYWPAWAVLQLVVGAVLSVDIGRRLASSERRRAEMHRQNLEFETLHLQSFELSQSLDRERGMLRQVLATVPMGVYWKDRAGVVLGGNDAMSALLGLPRASMLIGTGGPNGRPVPGGGTESEAQLRAERAVLADGRPRLDAEEQLTRADGGVVEVSASRVPLRDEAGAVVGVLGVVVDMTEAKRMERQLVHAHRMESIGQLSAGIAHEINTPAQFVSENVRFLDEAVGKMQRVLDRQSQLLDEDGFPRGWEERAEELFRLKEDLDFSFITDEAPRAVRESLEGLQRIRDIVNAMREFSHPGDANAQPFDLNRVVRTSATVCRNRWKYVAAVSFALDDALPPVVGHGGELGQVLVNLINNAADAVELRHPSEAGYEPRGRITLATRRRGDAVEVEVCDNGGGVPEAIRGRVFDPYFTTKDVGLGTGQGLAITHNVVVNKHGGSVEIGDAEGGGARFVLRLPVTPEPAKANETSARAA